MRRLQSLLLNRLVCHQLSTSTRKCHRNVHVAVVGSGPAGFYVTSSLLKRWPSEKLGACSVDMFERWQVPFGLVRFGVAPDHPEVKNCTHQLTKMADEFGAKKQFRFCGNVNVGRDLNVQTLVENYHIVILAYGASTERQLDIPGLENTSNCVSARSFVGWYNGEPTNECKVNLQCKTAIVLGHGNVALDVARILLTDPDVLAKTDISERALDQLRRSQIERVVLVGRRGPLQVSFTIAELREMIKLPGCQSIFDRSDFEVFQSDESILTRLERPKLRITQLMLDSIDKSSPQTKSWHLKFFRSPIEVLKIGSSISGVKFAVNNLVYSDPRDHKGAKAVSDQTAQPEVLECGLLVFSVGYKSLNIAPGYLPFDETRSVLKTAENAFCRLDHFPNVYGCGWCATGPRGTIATTQSFSKSVSQTIISDSLKGHFNGEKTGFEKVGPILSQQNVQSTTWDDWKAIDLFETKLGAQLGKQREKIVDLNQFSKMINTRNVN